MSPEPVRLADRISAETGLEFTGREGRDPAGQRWLELQPAGYPPGQTFSIRTSVGWRRLEVSFQPGTFSGELLEAMGTADANGRSMFATVIELCRSEGAEVSLEVNGVARKPEDSELWASTWRTMSLRLRKGMLAINDGDAAEDGRLIELWTARMAAAVLALLPLEAEESDDADQIGLPEGARTRIEVNRYERDRRNRAAALAIHGYSCKACGDLLAGRYGEVAIGLIEVHHVTPVSMLGSGYVIDPRSDLVPLCPNCHSVAHRRSPPFSVEELRAMVNAASSSSLKEEGATDDKAL